MITTTNFTKISDINLDETYNFYPADEKVIAELKIEKSTISLIENELYEEYYRITYSGKIIFMCCREFYDTKSAFIIDLIEGDYYINMEISKVDPMILDEIYRRFDIEFCREEVLKEAKYLSEKVGVPVEIVKAFYLDEDKLITFKYELDEAVENYVTPGLVHLLSGKFIKRSNFEDILVRGGPYKKKEAIEKLGAKIYTSIPDDINAIANYVLETIQKKIA